MNKTVELLRQYSENATELADKVQYTDFADAIERGDDITMPLELRYSISVSSSKPLTNIPVDAEITIVRDDFNNAIQNHLDSKAQEMRYDNIMSARSWAGYENPYQAEALKLAKWASECWTVAGQIETDVSSGARDMPTIDEVLSELPKYE